MSVSVFSYLHDDVFAHYNSSVITRLGYENDTNADEDGAHPICDTDDMILREMQLTEIFSEFSGHCGSVMDAVEPLYLEMKRSRLEQMEEIYKDLEDRTMKATVSNVLESVLGGVEVLAVLDQRVDGLAKKVESVAKNCDKFIIEAYNWSNDLEGMEAMGRATGRTPLVREGLEDGEARTDRMTVIGRDGDGRSSTQSYKRTSKVDSEGNVFRLGDTPSSRMRELNEKIRRYDTLVTALANAVSLADMTEQRVLEAEELEVEQRLGA